MLRLSKLTDYAVVVLVRLAQVSAVQAHAGERLLDAQRNGRNTGMQTSPGIAAATGIPEPTVAKVLKILTGRGLVVSQRGAHGGYRLVRSLAAIPISDVIAVIDGPIALTACVEGATGGCESENLCPVRGRWDPVNTAIREALGAITLADMQEAGIPRAFRVPAAAHAVPSNAPTGAPPTGAPAHVPAGTPMGTPTGTPSIARPIAPPDVPSNVPLDVPLGAPPAAGGADVHPAAE